MLLFYQRSPQITPIRETPPVGRKHCFWHFLSTKDLFCLIFLVGHLLSLLHIKLFQVELLDTRWLQLPWNAVLSVCIFGGLVFPHHMCKLHFVPQLAANQLCCYKSRLQVNVFTSDSRWKTFPLASVKFWNMILPIAARRSNWRRNTHPWHLVLFTKHKGRI